MNLKTPQPLIALCLLLPLAASLGCAGLPQSLGQPETRQMAPIEAPGDLNRDPDLSGAYYHYLAAQVRLNQGEFDAALEDLAQALELEPEPLALKREITQLYLRRGDLQAALEWARSAAEDAPQDVQSRLVLGGILSALGLETEATREYEKVRKTEPANQDALLLLGALYGRQKEYGKALEALKALIAADPDSFMAYYYLGRVCLEMNDLAAAEKGYLKAVELKPLFENALLDLAYIHELRGSLDKAAAAYEQILTANPTSRSARSRLGRLFLLGDRYDDALAQFEEMKRLGQIDQDVRIKIGLIYFEQKRLELAIKEFQEVLADDPENDRVRYYLGSCFEEKGDLDEARRLFQAVAEGSEVYVDALVHLALVLQRQDKLAEAEAAVRRAMDTLPQDTRLLLFLGALLEAQERYEAAVGVLQEALTQEPANTEVLFRLGVVLDKSGDQAGCIERMKQVVGLDANHASALNYLGYTYADKGINLEEAESLIKRALAQRPDDGFITDSLGWVYYKQRRYQEALAQMERAVALAKDDPVVTEHLGDVCAALGLEDRALAVYRKSLELNHEDKAAVQGKISRIEKDRRSKADAERPQAR
jgi:tetratricopeptide (TPR) repeat protein